MQVRHPNWCAAQYQNWLDFGLPLEHPKVDPATQVGFRAFYWLIYTGFFRFVREMTDLEHVEGTEEQRWSVLEKEDLLLWGLTVGEICVEELNFIHRYSQKVSRPVEALA